MYLLIMFCITIIINIIIIIKPSFINYTTLITLPLYIYSLYPQQLFPQVLLSEHWMAFVSGGLVA